MSCLLFGLLFGRPTEAQQATLERPERRESDWLRLPLPVGAAPLVDITQAESGELFVATEDSLYIRSPFVGDDGWERVWVCPDGDSRLAGIVAAGAIQGPDGDTVVVVSGTGVWAIRWQHEPAGAHPWQGLRYRFTSSRVGDPPGDVREVVANGDSAACRGYLTSGNGHTTPLIADGVLRLGPDVAIAHGTVEHFPCSQGWSMATVYGQGVLSILGPDGRQTGPVHDLEAVLAPPGHPNPRLYIHSVWHDLDRGLLFVGTSYGLAVADVTDESLSVSGPFHRVEALGLATVLWVGSSLGRLVTLLDGSAPAGLGVAAQSSSNSGRGPLWGESAPGRRYGTAKGVATHGQFVPLGSPHEGAGPESVARALHVSDDLFWVRDNWGGLWEWTVSGWQTISRYRDILDGVLMGPDSGRGFSPLVLESLDDRELLVWLPESPAPGWHVRRADGASANIVALVPDPGGSCFWSLDQEVSVVSYAFPRLFCPNGTHSVDSASFGGRRLDVARMSHTVPDGDWVAWPVSAGHGLLLPNGQDFVHVRGTEVTTFAVPAATPGDLDELTPGARSSSTAWLGLLRSPGGTSRAVRIDIPESPVDSVSAPEVAIQAVDIVIAGDTTDTALLPDSQGYVWLAAQTPSGWSASRISDGSGGHGPTVFLGILPDGERPRFLLLRSKAEIVAPQHILITDHGRVLLPRWELLSGLDRALSPLPRTLSEWTPVLRGSDEDLNGERFHRLIRAGVWSVDTVAAWVFHTEFVTFRDIATPATPLAISRIGDPSLGLTRLTRSAITGRALIGWLHEPIELLVWDSGQIEIPQLGVGTASRLVRVPLLENLSAVAASGSDIAVANRGSVAIRGFAGRQNWKSLRLGYVPARLTVRDDSGATSYDVTTGSLPTTLSHTTREVEILVRPYYDEWWQQSTTGVAATLDGRTWESADALGRIRLPVSPGQSYELGVRALDVLSSPVEQIARFGFSTHLVPVSPIPWLIAMAAMSICGIIVMFVASDRAYRWLLIRFGRRYEIVAGDTDHEVTVAKMADHATVTVRSQLSAATLPVFRLSDPLAHDECERLHACFRPRETVRVLADATAFRRPWAQWIGSQWSRGSDSVVAGQLAMLTGTAPSRPPRSRSLVLAGLCHPDGDEQLRLRPLPWARDDVVAFAAAARLRRATWHGRPPEDEGRPIRSELGEALEAADVVMVAAHANPEWILMGDGRFTVADLDALKPRCRLLFLRGCDAGDPRHLEGALLPRLVELGVNVLAATRPIHDNVARLFFGRLYETFLPRRARGPTLAEAIRVASQACIDRVQSYGDLGDKTEPVEPTLDSLVLYGDPSLHLRLARKQEERSE